MRALSVGLALLLISTGAAIVQASAPVKVHEEVDSSGDVDLHALCEELAKDCWDLDPADFGMTPVTTAIPPLPEGTVTTLEHEETLQVNARLLGQKVNLHGSANLDRSVSYDAEEGSAPAVPCGDPDGCPDLRVDARELFGSVLLDTRTFSASHCAVDEGSTEAGNRTLLRFSFKSPNDGLGDLVVGDPDDNPTWFEWGQCHGHWHFREYADYRLWDLEGYAAWKTLRTAYPHAEPEAVLDAFPELRDHFRAGHKQGFCVIDIVPPPVFFATGAGATLYGPAQYQDCFEDQGITRGWADLYHRFLDGQWVDVTGLPSGQYVLEAEVNPERFFAESSYTNNDSAVLVQF